MYPRKWLASHLAAKPPFPADFFIDTKADQSQILPKEVHLPICPNCLIRHAEKPPY